MNRNEMRQRLRTEMARVFETDPETLPNDACIDTVAQWDSLRHLMLMDAIETTFEVSFSHAEMVEMLDEAIIANTLANKLGAPSLH